MESPRKAITDKEINIKSHWPIFLMLIDVKFIMYQSIPKKIYYPPPGYTLGIWEEFCSLQWGIWSKIRPPQKDFVILSTFSMCTAFTGHCSYILSCLRWSFESLWRSPLNVDFLEWIILFKWTNLYKTTYCDFRYFRCV